MNVPSVPLRRERWLLLAALLALAGLAWGVVIWSARALPATGTGMSAGMSPVMGSPWMAASPTMGLAAPLFLAIWIVMMIAMMFPSAAPMILMYMGIARGRGQRGQAFAPTWVFVGGYLVVWAAAGLAAYLLATGTAWLLGRSPWLMAHTGQLAGALLIGAGIYQVTPLKSACLAKCRTPLQFVLGSWRDGYGGALRMGLAHGLVCLGCCWLLFVILFPLGIMNIVAMALLTALIFAEKALPHGRATSWVAGGALVLYGALVVLDPALLPGTMA